MEGSHVVKPVSVKPAYFARLKLSGSLKLSGRLAILIPALALGTPTGAFAGDSAEASSDTLYAEATTSKSGGLATGSAMKRSLNKDDANIVALVAEYTSYRKDLVTIAKGDVSSASVKKAHQRLASHDYKTLSKAWVAYNAAVAARTPAYNKEITKTARKRGQDTFLASLDASPDNVLRLKSSAQASKSIVRNISAETAQISEMGASFRKAAMDMQQSKTPKLVINRTTMDRFIDPARQDNIILAGASGGAMQDPRRDAKARPMLGQMLTLAAHMSVTEAKGGTYAASTAALVENRKGERCLKWAKLNLAQCLAATRNTSEEAYCTGRHALTEVSACWSYMAGPAGMSS